LADPFELVLQRALARRLLLFLLGETLLLLLEPGRVVALPRNALAAIELEDPAGDIIEEVTVMGHGHDRAGILGEEALEPRHRFRIEMVGRLIQQQHVGLLQQEPAQRHAPALAARQLGDIGVAGWAAQRIHGDVDGALQVPGIGGLDLLLELGLLGDQRLHLLGRDLLAEAGADGLEAVEQRLGAGEALEHVAEHVLLGIERRLLLQVADRDALSRPGLAGDVLVEAGHDLEQGRLARAVEAEHADLGAREERQPDVVQHLAAARVDLGQALHHVDVLIGGHRLLCAPVDPEDV
jgi:hypothetical protein